MRGNRSNRLCRLVTFDFSKKVSSTGVFLWIVQNFEERLFYRTPLNNCSWIFLFILGFFLLPGEPGRKPLAKRNQLFSIFGHMLSRLSNVMNIMNLKDLVAAALEHTFLGFSVVFFGIWLINISICLLNYMQYIYFLCSIVLLLFTHGTPKRQIKSKMKLEKAVIFRCSVKKVFLKYLLKLSEKHLYRSLFFNEVTH